MALYDKLLFCSGGKLKYKVLSGLKKLIIYTSQFMTIISVSSLFLSLENEEEDKIIKI